MFDGWLKVCLLQRFDDKIMQSGLKFYELRIQQQSYLHPSQCVSISLQKAVWSQWLQVYLGLKTSFLAVNNVATGGLTPLGIYTGMTLS